MVHHGFCHTPGWYDKIRDEHGMRRGYAIWYMLSVILPGGMAKVRDEHGMLRGYPFWYRISVILPSGVQNEGRA